MKRQKLDSFPLADGVVRRRGKRGIFIFHHRVNGEHRRCSLGTTDPIEARSRATMLLLNQQSNVAAPSRMALTEAYDRFTQTLEVNNRSPKTLAKYREIKNFIDFLAKRGVKFMHQITPMLFDDYRSIRAQKLKPRTLNNHGGIIKSWLTFAKSRQLIPTNPLADLTLPSVPRPQHPACLPEETLAILGKATGTLRQILATLAFTGMRVGECLNMDVEQIDLAGQSIRVKGSKTAAATRSVPIHPVLLPVLVEAIGNRKTGLLFPNPNPPTNPANRGKAQPWNDRTVSSKLELRLCKSKLEQSSWSLLPSPR